MKAFFYAPRCDDFLDNEYGKLYRRVACYL